MVTVSKKAEYALELIVFLSKNSDKSVSVQEVSKAVLLPYRFLGQLAGALKIGGIVESKEGKNGGYSLATGWQKKSLYELLEVLGENKPMVGCLGGTKCIRADKCRMKRVWSRVEMSLTKSLKEIKLGNI